MLEGLKRRWTVGSRPLWSAGCCGHSGTLFGGVKQVHFGGEGRLGYKNLVSLKLIVYSGGRRWDRR